MGRLDKGGGVKIPWVVQNGTRVAVDSEPVSEGRDMRWTFELPLVVGENRIAVQSASADGSWESEPAMITLNYEPSTVTDQSDLYLLSIGISKYSDETHDLEYAARDAVAFEELFKTRGVDSYGKKRVHIATLLDEAATLSSIEEKIAGIAEDMARRPVADSGPACYSLVRAGGAPRRARTR